MNPRALISPVLAIISASTLAPAAVVSSEPPFIEDTLANINFTFFPDDPAPQETGILTISPGGSGVWNNLPVFTRPLTPLLNAFGAPTGYLLFSWAPSANSHEGFTTPNIIQQQWNIGTFAILGLEPGETYRLVAFTSQNTPAVFQFPDQWLASEGNGNGGLGNGIELNDYIDVTQTANEFGQITFESTALAGFQIVQLVPEPGWLPLLASCGLLALRRRRRTSL